MLRFLALALLAACAGAAEPAAPAESVPEPRLSLPLELADAGAQAAMLWLEQGVELPRAGVAVEAGAGGIELILMHGLITDCGVAEAWGCTEPALFRGEAAAIFISDATPPELLVSVIAHELGHAQGLAHTADGAIMDPNRRMLPTCVFYSCLR